MSRCDSCADGTVRMVKDREGNRGSASVFARPDFCRDFLLLDASPALERFFMKKRHIPIRTIVVVAVMAALSSILQMLEFSVPFVPAFLKYDFSDLPAFITAFAISPVAGVLVQLVKNVIHLSLTHTGGVGELANFLIGALLVFPAGLIYQKNRTRNGAIWGSIAGALCGALISFPVNLFITYPFYIGLMGEEAILVMYRAILPSIENLWQALLIFNLPFTLVKGVCSAVITFFVYKPLSPILKGKKQA